MKIVLCLFVVAAFIATGEALKCYQCSITNRKCDAFDKSDDGVKETTCPKGYDKCSKITALLKNGTSITGRGCDYTVNITRASEVESGATFYCNTDLCNGVSSTGAAFTTLLVIIAPLIYKN